MYMIFDSSDFMDLRFMRTSNSCHIRIKFFYDRLGHLTKTIKPFIYSVNGELIQPTVEILYNAMGQAVATCDGCGQWTKTAYTVRGQPFRIEYPDGSIEQKEYSLDGLLIKEVAKNGLMICYDYDPLGRTICIEKYNLEGELLSTTASTYSTFRQLTETDEIGQTTYYDYDGAGRCIVAVKGDKTTLYSYDHLGRNIEETTSTISIAREYDLLGRVIEERQKSDGQIQIKIQYCYDTAGNRTHEISFTEAGIAIQETAYNPRREPTLIRNALGHTTLFHYGALNYRGQNVRFTISTDPLDNKDVKIFDTYHNVSHSWRSNSSDAILQVEDRIYDPEGRPLQSIAEVYTGSNPARTVVTEWTYDSMGNMVRCIEAKGTPEQKSYNLSYNLNGEKEKIIKPNGIVLHHTYDCLGRLQRFTSSDKTIDYLYTYDQKGNSICIEDKVHGSFTIRSYDLHDRLISETLDTGLTFSYKYDVLDRPLSITLPNLSAIHYHYNGNLLSRIDRIRENQVVYSHCYSSYDQAGNLLRMDLPDNVGAVHFAYDLLQRTISQSSPLEGDHSGQWIRCRRESYAALGSRSKRRLSL